MKYTLKKGTKIGAIVLIHGNSSSSKVFNDVFNSDKIKQTILTVDLPGHGESAAEYISEEDFFMASYINKLQELINSLDDDVLLAGNSLGGHIAIEVAPQINRLKGILIFGTPPVKKPLNLEEAYLPVPALQTFFTENPSDDDINTSVKACVFNTAYASSIYEDFKKANPKVRTALTVDVSKNNFLNEYEIFTNLPILKYIIAGTHDVSINPEYLRYVKNNSKGHCELISFKNCGHYPSLEKPTEFNNALKRIAEEAFK